MRFLFAVIFLCLSVDLQLVAGDTESRVWTSQRGSTIDAEFVKEDGGKVLLKGTTGNLIRIQIMDLIESDREYIKQMISLERKAINEKRAAVFGSGSRKRSAEKNVVKPEYLSLQEWEVIKETSLARQNPEFYIEVLEKYRRRHEGGNVFNTKHGHLMTQEGVAAVDEAIIFLKRQPQLSEIKPSAGLTRAARDHAKDIGVADIVGHTGSDGSSSRDRIERHGKWKELIGENIQFGEGDARDIVMQLIIDDGVPNRGHRTNIYNKAFKVAGVAIDRHKTYKSCCVIDYASGFRD